MDTPAPTPGILVAGHFDAGTGYATLRRAGTRDWLIAYTLAGRGRYRSGGQTFFVGPGDVTLLPPGVPHDYATPAGLRWEFAWAHFLPRPTWSPWLQLPAVAGGLRLLAIAAPSSRERIGVAFERLVTDARTGRAHGALAQELALNALEEVLLVCAREAPHGEASSTDARIRHVLDLLAADLAGAHRVADLAGSVALSPSRLAHLFKAQMGVSVLEMLLQMRLQHAAELLAYTTRGVADIAASVGFRSPYYFSRQFHRRYGLSPTAYRLASGQAAAPE